MASSATSTSVSLTSNLQLGPEDNSAAGAAWVFTRSGGGVGMKSTGPDWQARQ
jgi:hypothetical protein